MQMLAWLSVAMISSCPWPMSRRAEAIAASSELMIVLIVLVLWHQILWG